ncbi:PBP1A family penicillin-binding protein [Anaerolineales bacterium HSG25]|nr:PBP1A family penicillin-binding protein [Anaerolineales bacterium HSG25]
MTRYFKRITILSLIILAGCLILIWQILLVDLPDPNQLYNHTTAPSTKIYDRHGTLLYEITDPHQGLHTPLKLTDIPESCRNATISTEDATFYQNPGVDIWAIIRAIYINIEGGEVLSGGSTITQQLARNLLLTPDERREISLTRKLREAILAWRIARRYSKDEILTLYLNETYYGNLAYGIEAASRTYFGKHAAELDLAECAMLAGLPQSPANYNPLENLDAAKIRQRIVLDLMVKGNYITDESANSAQREKLGYAAIPFPIKAPHFVMYIRGELERRFGLEAIYRQGLEVHTTLDLDMQNAAQRIVQYRLADLTEERDGVPPRNVRNSAVVVLEPYSGDVLVMLGSPDYFDPDIDGAVNATTSTRQPGSSIKPITYAAAFDPSIASNYSYEPLTGATMMMDVRTAFVTKEGNPYAPENYDRTWRGPVLLRQSLASSYNLVAVKVLDYVGLKAMIDLARRMGITTFDHREFGLALTLGGGEVRLLELTGSFATFANGGQGIEPVTITRITDRTGKIVYEWQADNNPQEQVIHAETAYLITDILSDNHARRSTFGAGSPLKLSRPAAAKTGTTQDWRDNWTVGYTPDLVVGVWTGNADNEPMRNVSGVTGAAPIWHDMMEILHKGRPVREFTKPAGFTEKKVCRENGLLPYQKNDIMVEDNDYLLTDTVYQTTCPHTINELFINGTEPHKTDNWHQKIAIDRRNGLRAGKGCPLEFVTFLDITQYPTEAEEWAITNGVPLPPRAYSPLCSANGMETTIQVSTEPHETKQNPLIFLSPDQGAVFRLVANIPLEKQKIDVTVRPANEVQLKTVSLFVNGEKLTEGSHILWQLKPGNYNFEAIGLDVNGNEIRSGKQTIRVVE